jgi:hypothetical protein
VPNVAKTILKSLTKGSIRLIGRDLSKPSLYRVLMTLLMMVGIISLISSMGSADSGKFEVILQSVFG